MTIQGIRISKEKLNHLQLLFGVLKNKHSSKIISFIADYPGVCNREIAKHLGISEQNCRALLNKMVEAGILEIDLTLRKGKNDIPYKLNTAVLSKARQKASNESGKEVSFNTAYSIVVSFKNSTRIEMLNRIDGKEVPMKQLGMNRHERHSHLKPLRDLGVLIAKKPGKEVLLTVNKNLIRKIFF